MRKIIIDCDPGIDDALAIMLAVNSPELEIVAITTVSGNVPSDMGAVNAKKVLRQLNRLDIPVYIGEDAPLREEYIDARDTHGMDGLGESFLLEVSSGCEKQSAVDFLTEILEKECAAAKAADVQTWNRYSDEFHLVFYRYCNNSRLAESAERLRSGISIFSNQYCRETVIQTRIDEEHLAIFQAYKDGDIEKAVQMMKTHLNDSLNYALRFLPKTF